MVEYKVDDLIIFQLYAYMHHFDLPFSFLSHPIVYQENNYKMNFYKQVSYLIPLEDTLISLKNNHVENNLDSIYCNMIQL